MEEGVSDRKDDKNKKMMREKWKNAQMTLPLRAQQWNLI